MQYRTINSLCRRCHHLLESEDAEPLAPFLVTGHATQEDPDAEIEIKVAGQVRAIRLERHLSQRQLASRMRVPRTYISKIENGKATPTLSSLERLALALDVELCRLVRDDRGRREEEVFSILSDPFLAEIAPLVPGLDSLHRALFLGAVRDMAMGRRRTA